MALRGIKVIELSGLAPSPYAGLMLQQHGADVVVVDRSNGSPKDPSGGAIRAGKESVAVNLKSAGGVATLKRLVAQADVLVEPFRPGVMEKLGLGPNVLLALNPRLVYARLTGWGQDGPLSQTAGHDINYIGLTGALAMMKRNEPGAKPTAPVNLLGDFAGGGMLCVVGVLMALLERERNGGKGQVVDVAMVDGVTHLNSFVYRMRAADVWSDVPGTNVLDTGAPFYDTYECKHGGFMAVGAIEAPFYKLLVRGLGMTADDSLPKQMDIKRWPELRQRLTAAFRTRTRDEWAAIFSQPHLRDACCTPVLSMGEASENEHMKHRGALVQGPAGAKDLMPAPAPRFSRTAASPSPMGKGAVPKDGEHTVHVLKRFGFSDAEVADLIAGGDVVQQQGVGDGGAQTNSRL